MSPNELLVDLRSAAKKASPAEVAAWAGEQRAFISSVMAELKPERAEVARAVRRLGADPIWFEEFGGLDADPEDAYIAEVASSSIYIGLLGREYGRLLKSRRSATHAEYRKAESSGLHTCVWTKEGVDPTGDQRSFLQEVQTFHVTGKFDSVERLGHSVRDRLVRLAAEELSPWCKVDNVIFRATSVHDNGKEVDVLAVIHDPTVEAAIVSMRPTFWSEDVKKVTYAGQSRNLQLKTVETKLMASRTAHVQLRFVPASPTDDRPVLHLSARDYSTDDLIEVNLGKVLFKRPGPGGLAIVGGTIRDPLAGIRRLRPPEEILRPLIHLFLTEALVGSGQAARVTRVRLSQAFERNRQLLVEWQPRGSVAPRTLEGPVQI